MNKQIYLLMSYLLMIVFIYLIYFRVYFPYRQYTNLFIFRFVSEYCLRSTLRLFQNIIHLGIVQLCCICDICIYIISIFISHIDIYIYIYIYKFILVQELLIWQTLICTYCSTLSSIPCLSIMVSLKDQS